MLLIVAPFSLGRLADVSRYVYKSSFIPKCDDKSGYDHVMVTDGSQAYVGFTLGRLWLVCSTLPFGCKISPYNYHSIGLAATGFLRSQGIPCSLFIDDRLNGEIITATGPWSKRPRALRLEAAKAALYVVLSLLLELGDTTGMKKSVLAPTTSLEYLGLIVDSDKQSSLILQHKRETFALWTITPCHWKCCFQANAHLFRWLCLKQNFFLEKSIKLDLTVQGKIN